MEVSENIFPEAVIKSHRRKSRAAAPSCQTAEAWQPSQSSSDCGSRRAVFICEHCTVYEVSNSKVIHKYNKSQIRVLASQGADTFNIEDN